MVAPLGNGQLRTDEALEVDCNNIQRTLFPDGFPPPGYIKGFLIIRSAASLDVVAVYTSANLDANGHVVHQSGIEIERVPERRVRPQLLPDLLPIPKGQSSGPGAFCVRRDGKLVVTIRNRGLGAAPRSVTEVEFLGFSRTSVATDALPLPSPRETEILLDVPRGCLGPDGQTQCRFRITADAAPSTVAEANEDNNVAEGACFFVP